jgi:hypothetical protein
MTLGTSVDAGIRLPEFSDAEPADPDANQQPAMTVTVQVTLPRTADAARLAGLGADSLEIAAVLAERLHTIAATRARELMPDADVSTTVSMVTQSLATVDSPGQAPAPVPLPPGVPPAQRTPALSRQADAAVPQAGRAAAESDQAAAPPAGQVSAPADDAVALHIMSGRREALLDGVALVLTRREYELLVFLAERPGRVFTRRQLLNWVWGEDVVSGERTVDVHVRRLRAKLRRRGPVITTIRGVGYRLDRAERVAVS